MDGEELMIVQKKEEGLFEEEGKLPESHFASVKGSQIHYYDEGEGDPILFLHGIPTSAYLWRKVIPFLSSHSRCVAPDFIGMGKSGKPDLEYRVFDHINYIHGFIEKLGLKNITLVLHGWGSVIGFDYAKRYPENIKAIAFYESHLEPATEWGQLSLPIQQVATLLNHPGASYRAIMKQNYFVEKMLPRCTLSALSEEEMNYYRAPFSTIESRKPIWQFINELPLGRKAPKDVVTLMEDNLSFLQTVSIPKLMFYAIPGFMTTMESVGWAKANLSNLELYCFEDALHLAQESVPEKFAGGFLDWYKRIDQASA